MQGQSSNELMENESILTKILADYKILLSLKFNSPQVIHDKLKLMHEHAKQLTVNSQDGQEKLTQATSLLESAMEIEYTALQEVVTSEDKEQVLAKIKHKAAEACRLIGLQG